MRSSLLLFIISFFCSELRAQQNKKATGPIDKILSAITDFSSRERKRDSVLNHPLGSNTEADFLRRYNFYDSVFTQLNKIDKASLTAADQVNRELLLYEIADERSPYIYKTYLNPILSESGFHTNIVGMGSQVLSKKEDAEEYLKRLKDIGRYMDEHLDLMNSGLKAGVTHPASIMSGYENTYDQHIVSDPEKSSFYKPFLKKPSTISEEDWTKMQGLAKNYVKVYVIESYKKVKYFFENDYLPRTRKTVGVSFTPNGLAYYEDRVHHYTTTNLTSEEVYQIGLKEVTRIHTEMLNVMYTLRFSGTLQQFINFLRTDPRFYATTPEQLLKEASFIAKKADGLLPQLFGRLPRQPYGVEPVPAHLAPTYTAGRYSGAPIRSKRAGNYWVNTYDLKSRPIYALEALTLHEAVPGHHLQIALTQELDSLPAFRRNLYVNAFGEGWGLYSEYLGHEMGFYKDPYSLFGRLTYEMWRACRLVIDVGLHTKGWTREQAVKYLADNTALSLHEVNTEINRYISWPGQALAYKMGELKIKEMRKRAEEKLGVKFDVREFHDLILSQGTVTLKILEEMVDEFIRKKML